MLLPYALWTYARYLTPAPSLNEHAMNSMALTQYHSLTKAWYYFIALYSEAEIRRFSRFRFPEVAHHEINFLQKCWKNSKLFFWWNVIFLLIFFCLAVVSASDDYRHFLTENNNSVPLGSSMVQFMTHWTYITRVYNRPTVLLKSEAQN